MSSRNFPNFLDAYLKYSDDNFCPEAFHRWTGISVLSAALQRKVSLKQGKIHHIPNLYVMLVSHPAVGKTTAMDIGVDLLEELKKNYNRDFRIIPNQATEPALIDMMKIIQKFQVPGTGLTVNHSSGFFYASEASASALQNTCGDFVSAMTALYDCPKFFRKKLKSDMQPTEIENACVSMLAGATFNYLKELVNERSVLGGFASRLIYVVSKERKVRQIKWGQVASTDPEMKRKLLEDLVQINKLCGPVTPTQGFIERFEEWQPAFDQEMIDMESERREAIISRKGTNLIKLAIVLSVSESDDLVVSEKHFDKAKELIDEVTRDNTFIISQAMINNKDSQAGLNVAIMQIFEKNGGEMPLKKFRKVIMSNGNDSRMIENSINSMIVSGILEKTKEDNYKLTSSSAEII